MKTINSELMAATLALPGCGAATLRDLGERDLPSESFTYLSRGCEPYSDEIKIKFRPDGYVIECNFNHYFTYDFSGNFLKWGELRFADNNFDDLVDEIYASYIPISLENLRLRNRAQLRYNEALDSLGQEEINDMWLARWR